MLDWILRRLAILALTFTATGISAVALAENKLSPLPHFEYQISAIPSSLEPAVKKYLWHPECPVPLQDLAYVKLSYWGMDHKKHIGFIIINKKLAKEIVDIFREIYQSRFPIERMEPIPYNTAVATNDTSAFYCRANRSRPGQFSMHSYGYAIDINTLLNPYTKGSLVLPPEGARYRDRTHPVPGMIVRGDKVYQAFIQHGWKWGGDFTKDNIKDYMHFEKDLRQQPMISLTKP